MKNLDLPAFPINDKDLRNISKFYSDDLLGLTKREYFAGLAMQGILSSPLSLEEGKTRRPKTVAEISIEYADAILSELEATKNEQK